MFRLDQQLGGPSSTTEKQANGRHLARHSLGAATLLYDSKDVRSEDVPPASQSRPLSMHSAYSASEAAPIGSKEYNGVLASPKTDTEPQFQTNGASTAAFGRLTANGRQKTSPDRSEAKTVTTQPQQNSLQANAAPFGPSQTTPPSANSTPGVGSGVPPLANIQVPYFGYPVQPYTGNSAAPVNGQTQNYNNLGGNYPGYGGYGSYRFSDSPNKAINARRSGEGESPQMSRFSNFPLEHYQGELYSLCKDQHGCRYLQRKLEEQNPENVQIIFNETHRHVVELMTG